ncbi:MAG: hypothetical protein VKJ04_09005 [Vampirovibrionales bacterium]|nr:hypothetical protein [Vampirovibrionales bacterium]
MPNYLQAKRFAYKASALVITLVFIVLLGLEALMVSMILVRSTGAEAGLRGQNLQVKRAGELVLDTLKQVIYNDVLSNDLTPAQAWAKYKRGGSDTTYSNLASNRYNVVNPESGANDPLGIETAAWIQEVRGDYYHLVGRARLDGVDIMTNRWVMISPSCVGGGSGAAAGLTTIVTGVSYPGFRSTAVDPVTGRVFFSNVGFGTQTGKTLWTWHSSTGLSTIVTNQNGVAGKSIMVADDGRVFFGEGNSSPDSFWTWKDNILSTLSDGWAGAGRRADDTVPRRLLKLDKRTGRIYWGSAGTGGMATWKNGVMTTIHSSGPNFMYNMAIGAPDEAFFVNGETGYKIYRWTPATGLTTVFNLSGAGITNYPDAVAGANSNGRVFFGENNSPALAYTYQLGAGLTTLPFQHFYFGHPNYYLDKNESAWFHEFATGHVVIADDGGVYTWNPSVPTTLVKLPSNAWSFMRMNHSKTLVAYAEDGGSTTVRVWGPTSGLSTVPGLYAKPGYIEGAAWSYDDRYLYFGGEISPGRFYQWEAATNQLSTIFAGPSHLGIYGVIATDSNGFVYFGPNISGASMYAYSGSTGLTTIVSGLDYPGDISTHENPQGGVYFGQWASPGNFYYYSPGSTCTARTF